MKKRISFIVITAFVVSLPMTSIWFHSSINPPSTNVSDDNSLPEIASAPTLNSVISDTEIKIESFWDAVKDKTSLKDTNPPTTFNVIHGLVQQDEALRAIFEYFLALDGELSMEEIKNALKSFALDSLTDQQSQEVLAAFDRYYEYLAMMSEDQLGIPSDASFKDKFEWIKLKRREHFGDTIAEAYFGYDEVYDDYSLAKLDIMQNDHLSIEERNLALQELTNSMPIELREREGNKSATKSAIQLNRNIVSNESESSVYQERLNAFGYEATERLTSLDQQRNEWSSRYDIYQSEANAILDSDLANIDKQNAIEQLRATHFNEREQIRVAALDQINSLH